MLADVLLRHFQQVGSVADWFPVLSTENVAHCVSFACAPTAVAVKVNVAAVELLRAIV